MKSEGGGSERVREGGGERGCMSRQSHSQLTDLVGHFLQFVLRTTHDDHIQPSSGQLEMKQPSNHVCN